jgi:hypothetical protein
VLRLSLLVSACVVRLEALTNEVTAGYAFETMVISRAALKMKNDPRSRFARSVCAAGARASLGDVTHDDNESNTAYQQRKD